MSLAATDTSDNPLIEFVTLDQLVVSQNGSDGIRVGSRATITNTKANGNGSHGIHLDGKATLDAVTVVGNGSSGIYSEGCCVMASRVEARRNGFSDFAEDKSGLTLNGPGNVISQSTAEDNADHGIDLNGDHNVVVGSVVRRNRENGIEATGFSNVALDSVATRNEEEGVELEGDDHNVVRTQANRNDSDGVVVELGGVGTRIVRVVASHNEDQGIETDGDEADSAIIVRSTANKNSSGVVTECPSNLLLVQASGNPDGNVVLADAGNCALLKSSAP